MTTPAKHQILIVGGGTAGISVAARMLRKGYTDVAVIGSRWRPNTPGAECARARGTDDDAKHALTTGLDVAAGWFAQNCDVSMEPVRQFEQPSAGERLHQAVLAESATDLPWQNACTNRPSPHSRPPSVL